MARGRDLTASERARICELHTTLHWGATRIHKVHPEWPVSTINYTIRMERKRQDNASLSRSGRPRALTEEDRERISQLITQNPRPKMKDLLDSVDNKIKARAMRMLCSELRQRKS